MILKNMIPLPSKASIHYMYPTTLQIRSHLHYTDNQHINF